MKMNKYKWHSNYHEALIKTQSDYFRETLRTELDNKCQPGYIYKQNISRLSLVLKVYLSYTKEENLYTAIKKGTK